MAGFDVWVFATPMAREATWDQAVATAARLSDVYRQYDITVVQNGRTLARFVNGEEVA